MIQPVFTINGTQLQTVPLFKYLGSIVAPTTKIDEDVFDNISKASRSFVRLRTRVFQNNHLSLITKINVYEVVCISTLLYGSKTSTVC